ncbi:hypothetical protein SLS62_002710 [Diatrype stigma]|uniref:Uncharacterized protein n=1 Tax=Diatrype stigma TaxID=117547 RepID=A0AAN9UTY0_9PEZI
MAVAKAESNQAHDTKITKKTAAVPAPICEQQSSLFFQRLPPEVRDLVYSYYFHSTRLSHGAIPFSWGRRILVKTAPNSLALLRTCRRTRAEVGDIWLGQVLFNFEDCRTMLDKLTALPEDTLSKIRHLRVRGDALLPSWPGHDYNLHYYRLASAFKLLPGLQLDTLTVLRGCCSDAVSYDTLSALIAEGDGWKELRYISHNSTLLGFASAPDTISPLAPKNDYVRKPQPEHWRSVLLQRDGAASKPSVEIYRSTKDREVGSVIQRDSQVRYEQKTTESADKDSFAAEEDGSLCTEGESFKELLIVARRGDRVDYREKEGSPFIHRDIRQDIPGMTWQEIKDNYIDVPRGSEEGDYPKGELDPEVKGQLPEVDQYHDVDEYIWTLFHFGLEHLW